MQRTTITSLTVTFTLIVFASWSPSVGAGGAELRCAGAVVTIEGNGDANQIVGTAGDDVIFSGAGHDIIDSGAGNDIICSGAGDDQVHAGIGNDSVYGGPGADSVIGGRGTDLLLGMVGTDDLKGGAGIDVIGGGRGLDVIYGGAGWDECAIGNRQDIRNRCEARIVAEAPGDLLGVALGSEADAALSQLTATIGRPRSDSGWTTGCELDGDTVTLDSRVVSWGSLRAYFVGTPGDRTLLSWSVPLFDEDPEPLGPAIADIDLPGGYRLGDAIGDVADALGEVPVSGDPFSGLTFTVDDVVEISTLGTLLSDPIDTVQVGDYEVCD